MATEQSKDAESGTGVQPPTDGKKDSKADRKSDNKTETKTETKIDGKTDTKPDTPAAAPGDAPKKLTGAELKALKQAEKAKRRAAVVAAKGTAGGAAGAAVAAVAAAGQSKPGPGGGAAGKGKGKQGTEAAGGAGAIAGSLPRRPAAAAGGGGGGAAAAAGGAAGSTAAAEAAASEKDPRSVIPECFSHLGMAKRITVAQAHKDVHPAVLAVGQQMATFVLRDSIARLEAMLGAFKLVIQSYRTPPGNAFSRHFVSHVLNPQIEYLTECRPMCFAMGNGIRLLKARVSQLDLDLDDKDAIELLCESIDGFLQERTHIAAVVITHEAAAMIHDGDTILTYGGARLVRAALDQAAANGVRFNLIVVDDPADPAAGQALAKHFRNVYQKKQARASAFSAVSATSAASFNSSPLSFSPSFQTVTYSPSLDGLDSHVNRASKVFLGVESVFANGALLARAGTCEVAQSASALGRPVIALTETINFDRDRVATDALAHNEIDPDHCDSNSFRLLFDTTQSSLVNMLITEYEEASGMVPAHAIYSVLRSKEDPN